MKQWQSPVKAPRWTPEGYAERKAAYNEKHGYEINIPGFRDIFVWNIPDEPTTQEVALQRLATQHERGRQYYVRKLGEERYAEMKKRRALMDIRYSFDELHNFNMAEQRAGERDKFIDLIGQERYETITQMRQQKKELYQRMLNSPVPAINNNATSALTLCDDINDTLGTLGAIATVAAQKLPGVIAQAAAAEAGLWLFTAANVAGMALDLSNLPFKAFRLQRSIHGGVNLSPENTKGRISKARRIRQRGLGFPEIIEAAQVTRNMFGFGLCLGPLMGLVLEIPAGFYRHVRGEKVTVKGLPEPLYWFDRQWAKAMRAAVEMWIRAEGFTDEMLAKSMVAMNMAYQVAKNVFGGGSILDYLPDTTELELPPRRPEHPLTKDVVAEVTGELQQRVGSLINMKTWLPVNKAWDDHTTEVAEAIRTWLNRNAKNQQAMVAAQNSVQAAMQALSLAEGEEFVQWGFDATSQSVMNLMNQNYRFPEDATQEQAQCFAKQMKAYDVSGIEPSYIEAMAAAKLQCGFEFTTKIPNRYPDWYLKTDEERYRGIEHLRSWYFWTWMEMLFSEYRCSRYPDGRFGRFSLDKFSAKYAWLREYGMPIDQPHQAFSLLDKTAIHDMEFCIRGLAARVYALYDPYPELKTKIYTPWLQEKTQELQDLSWTLKDPQIPLLERQRLINRTIQIRKLLEDPSSQWNLCFVYRDVTNYDAIQRHRVDWMGIIRPQYDWDGPAYNFWGSIMMIPVDQWRQGWEFRKFWVKHYNPYVYDPTQL